MIEKKLWPYYTRGWIPKRSPIYLSVFPSFFSVPVDYRYSKRADFEDFEQTKRRTMSNAAQRPHRGGAAVSYASQLGGNAGESGSEDEAAEIDWGGGWKWRFYRKEVRMPSENVKEEMGYDRNPICGYESLVMGKVVVGKGGTKLFALLTCNSLGFEGAVPMCTVAKYIADGWLRVSAGAFLPPGLFLWNCS